MKGWKIMWGIKFLVMIVAMIALFAYAVMALWNWLIPEIFSGPTINWVQSLGLLVLTKILFWAPRSMHYGKGGHWKHRHWKRKFEEKMAGMTPEEREKYKQHFRQRCGWYGEEEDTKAEAADNTGTETETSKPTETGGS